MEVIGQDDILARAIFYKTSFQGHAIGVNALLAFQGSANPDGSFDESLGLKRLTSDTTIHVDNCVAAALKNDRVRANRIRKGQPPDPVSGVDKKYYCGYTQAQAKALLLKGDNYRVEIIHAPEGDILYHVAIYLRPEPGKRLVANDRTEAGRLLALAFKDPVAWICGVDVGDLEHPVAKHGEAALRFSDIPNQNDGGSDSL